MALSDDEIQALEERANDIRKSIIEMLVEAGTGHTAGPPRHGGCRHGARGYFPISELKTSPKFGSRLQDHRQREFLPMLQTSSRPLGSGLSQAAGMALADRIDRGRSSARFIYCLMPLTISRIRNGSSLLAQTQFESML